MLVFFKSKLNIFNILFSVDNSKNFIKISGPLGSNLVPFKGKVLFVSGNNFKFFFFKKFEIITFWKNISRALIGVCLGWSVKMDLSGRGYFVSRSLGGLLIFNLGHSHGISILLPESVYCTYDKKKRMKFTLHGTNFSELYNLVDVLRKLKPVDPYKGRGVRFEDEIIVFKPGKKDNNS